MIVEGRAEVLTGGAEFTRAIDLLVAKYPQYRGAAAGSRRRRGGGDHARAPPRLALGLKPAGPVAVTPARPSSFRCLGRALRGALSELWRRRDPRLMVQGHARCAACGLRFERGDEEEHDYWLGAYTLNFLVTETIFGVALLLALLAPGPIPRGGCCSSAAEALMVVAPIAFYPVSKTLWLAIDLVVPPAGAGRLPAVTPVVRPATPADAGGIATVQVRAWRAAYQRILSDTFLRSLSIPARTTRWDTVLREAVSQTYVAELSSEVIGWITVGGSRGPARQPPSASCGPSTLLPSTGIGGRAGHSGLADARTSRRRASWTSSCGCSRTIDVRCASIGWRALRTTQAENGCSRSEVSVSGRSGSGSPSNASGSPPAGARARAAPARR